MLNFTYDFSQWAPRPNLLPSVLSLQGIHVTILHKPHTVAWKQVSKGTFIGLPVCLFQISLERTGNMLILKVLKYTRI